MFCTQCGAPVPGGAKFCPACGTPVAGIPAPQTPAAPEGAPVAPPAPPPVQAAQAAASMPVQPIQNAVATAAAVQPIQGVVATAAAAKGLSGVAKLVITLLLVVVVGGGGYVVYQQATYDPDAEIRQTVENLEVAFNRADFNGMLDCFDPAYAAIYKGATSLVGSVVGFDVGTVMDGLFGLASILPPETTGLSEMPTLDLTVNSISYLNDYTADVSLTITVTQDGQTYSENLPVGMIYKDKTWYFSGDGLFW